MYGCIASPNILLMYNRVSILLNSYVNIVFSSIFFWIILIDWKNTSSKNLFFQAFPPSNDRFEISCRINRWFVDRILYFDQCSSKIQENKRFFLPFSAFQLFFLFKRKLRRFPKHSRSPLLQNYPWKPKSERDNFSIVSFHFHLLDRRKLQNNKFGHIFGMKEGGMLCAEEQINKQQFLQ